MMMPSHTLVTALLDRLYLPLWTARQMQLDADSGLDVPVGLVCMYVITSGSGWLDMLDDDRPPIRLVEGDHVLLPHSHAHRVVARTTTSSQPIADWLERPYGKPHGPEIDAARVSLLHGQFQPQQLHFNPLEIGLPRVIRLNHHQHAPLRSCVPLLTIIRSEEQARELGWELTVRRLAQLIFLKTLGVALTLESAQAVAPGESPGSATARIAAIIDPTVGPVLNAITDRPGEPWTVPSMAKSVRVSKSHFSERFRNLVGKPPLQYLTEIRMQKASCLLRESDLEISNIAALVGYESPSSFSNAFKRHCGCTPAEYRKWGCTGSGRHPEPTAC
ncbi:HTH-type transcriptional activator Btr [Stieleria neptunia]|uniref:HTH-type transcriptional activator Btr n=1 Tax=Stieleria neptunia TaxID=2527979 RepID=A0A518HV10_9BACT|nr:AraC family transcriptional regulator [Stieleria neptunia]QDV44695.1 HTH-type transcriptional activator Btr [Stieleria neptunia]